MLGQWVQLFIGVGVMLSPWLLGFSGITVAMWVNLVVGIALILINLWTIFGSKKS